MKFSIKFAAILFTFFTLSACASKHTRLRKLRPGVFKRQVLSKFGDPQEKYRSSGRDHWIYETQKRSKKVREPIIYQHTLVFEEGVLLNKKISRTFTSKELDEFYKKD